MMPKIVLMAAAASLSFVRCASSGQQTSQSQQQQQVAFNEQVNASENQTNSQELNQQGESVNNYTEDAVEQTTNGNFSLANNNPSNANFAANGSNTNIESAPLLANNTASANIFPTNTPALESAPLNAVPVNSAVTNMAATAPDAPINFAGNQQPPVNGLLPAAVAQEAQPAPPQRLVDLGPPHGVLSWVGYNYNKPERRLEVQIVTQGKPVYKIFQEVNRAKQPEIVVRFLNTELRHKIRRDIDATEFRSPVAFIRMRRDNVFKHTDVILTMRDPVQPKFFAKGSSVMLSFDIPERWFGPAANSTEPVAKLEISPDANLMPVIDSASDAVPQSPKSQVAVYVNDPGNNKFGGVAPNAAQPLQPVEGTSELVPSQAPVEAPPQAPPSVPASDKTEVRVLEERFIVAGVAQANGNFSYDIPAPVTNGAPIDGTGSNFSVPVETPVESVPVTDVTGVDPNTGAETGGTVQSRKLMKLDFRNATIGSIMRAIASDSGLNFVMPPEVSNQKVTISLSNVSWDVALKAVLESNRLGMEEIGPRIVRIDTLKTFVDDRDAQEKAKQSTEALVPTKVLVMRLSYANVEDAAKLVKEMIPKPNDPSNLAQKRNYDRFKVQADKRSNALIVEATPNELAKIKVLVERLDMRTPQVKISSRIVEVLEQATNSFGLKWDMPFNMDSGRGLGFGSLPFPNSLSSGFAVDPGFSGSPVGAGRMRLGSINNAVALDITLRALESKSQVESLQNQDILVEDNQDAEIKAGKTDFFALPGTSTGEPKLMQVDYETKLKVTPHITADGAVQMKLEVTGDEPTPPSSPNANAGKITRNVTTTLLRRSGDTAVIGGLYSTNKLKASSGVPFLSSIPIIGALFRSSNLVDSRRDLLIMITPTIQTPILNDPAGSGGAQPGTTSYNSAQPTNSNFAAPPSGNMALNTEAAAPQQGAFQQQQQEQMQQQQQQATAQQQGQQQLQQQQQQGETVEVSDDVDLE